MTDLKTDDISYLVSDYDRICALDNESMESVGVKSGEWVEIIGKRRTIAKCISYSSVTSYGNKGKIGLTRIISENAGAFFTNDTVIVNKIIPEPAKRIIVSPLKLLTPEVVDKLNSHPKLITGSNLDAAIVKGNYLTLELSGDSSHLHFQVLEIEPNDIDAALIDYFTTFRVQQATRYSTEEKIKMRFQFLHKLYNITDGRESVKVDAISMGSEIGFNYKLVRGILEYLVQEKLVGIARSDTLVHDEHVFPTFLDIAICHRGVKEIENALNRPDRPTKFFPIGVAKKVFINITSVNNMNTEVYNQIFRNIKNSTIINQAQVQNSFNKIKDQYGNEELGEVLVKAAEFINKSKDPSAAALFNEFTIEYNKSSSQQSKLKKLWLDIERILPRITVFTDPILKIISLVKEVRF